MKMIWNYCPFWIILYLIPLQACWRLSSVKESKDVKWTLNYSRHVEDVKFYANKQGKQGSREQLIAII